jgi:hypothetical protein
MCTNRWPQVARPFLFGVTTLVAVTLAGCGGWDYDRQVGLRLVSRTVTTSTEEGFARVRVPLVGDGGDTQDVRKFLMASRVIDGDQTVYVERIEGEDGGVLRSLSADLQRDQIRSGAVADQELNHFNWPIGSDDPDLSGEYVDVFIGAVTAERTLLLGAKIDVQVLANTTDTDFSTADFNVVIHYAGGIDGDPEYVAAMEGAVAKATELFAVYGLNMNVSYQTTDVGDLPRPGFGAADSWTDLTTSTSDLAIDVVFVDTIAGSDAAILGASGSIPGGLLGSEKSGVILSAAANAGPDLRYSDREVDLLGTTLAHELGHMFGLFHPVERDYDRWDALDDTIDCDTQASCEGALGTNLMYPTALCTSSSCVDQVVLTVDQTAVANRYTGVD